MRSPLTRTLFFLALTVGCGSDGASGDPKGPAGTDPVGTEAPDETAPEVVLTAPEDGAIGQYADVVVEIAFSEPMDAASVEAALDASELGEVSLSWNEAGDTLSILPAASLEYASGAGDDPSATANRYAVHLADTATDLAGNPLAEAVVVQFDTLRELWMATGPIDDLTRSLTPAELLFDVADPLVVGDTLDDQGVRAVISFNLWFLPEGTVEVTEATLATRQMVGDTWGNPYGDLGDSLLIHHVTFSGLDDESQINGAFNSHEYSMGYHAGFCAEDQVVIAFDLTAEVDDDVANRAARMDRAQFMLTFDSYTDLDGAVDRAVISRDLMELQLTYLAP